LLKKPDFPLRYKARLGPAVMVESPQASVEELQQWYRGEFAVKNS
jgi:hypothetical protein